MAVARRNGPREEAIVLLCAKAEESKFLAEDSAIIMYVSQLPRTNRAEQAAFDAPLQKMQCEVARRTDRRRSLLRNAVRRGQRARSGGAIGRRQSAGVARTEAYLACYPALG